MRALMLVIASRTEADHDDLLLRAWVPYVLAARERHPWLDTKLVFGRGADLSGLEAVADAVFVGTQPDGYGLPIFAKTIEALQRFNGYDYVVRTNLSSFVCPVSLRAWLDKRRGCPRLYASPIALPMPRCVPEGHPCWFGSGAFVVLSRVTAAALLAAAPRTIEEHSDNSGGWRRQLAHAVEDPRRRGSVPDDIAIALALGSQYDLDVGVADGVWRRLRGRSGPGTEAAAFLELLDGGPRETLAVAPSRKPWPRGRDRADTKAAQ